MTILAVAQRGEPILGIIAAPVTETELGSEWLSQLANALMDTMMAQHGVGIAAPQVYVSKRVIIVASRANPRYPDAPDMEPIVMVNPEITFQSEHTLVGEEGCLSVPNERAEVARSAQIKVRYLTLNGDQVEANFEGFPARIVQHEIDHLNGILFVERLSNAM